MEYDISVRENDGEEQIEKNVDETGREDVGDEKCGSGRE